MKTLVCTALGAAALAFASGGSAHATAFVNGDFETGDFSGWTLGGGSRASTPNASLTTAMLLPGGSLYNSSIASSHSAVVGTGYVDPNLGSRLGSTVFSGNYSARVEDTTIGGYASVISQTVANYTDPMISFAYKAVLENGGHTADESAEMLVELTDVTKGTVLVHRQFNAGANGVGVDNTFSQYQDFFYNPQWQSVELNLDPSDIGDTFTLSVLGADCEPTGHTGYIYLDGFGAANPVTPVNPVNPVDPGTAVPEPATFAVLGMGLLGLVAAHRRGRA